MTLWQIVRESDIYNVRCFGELCLSSPKNNTEDLCNEFIEEYIKTVDKFPALFYYGDASGTNRTTQSKEHNFDILERVLKPYLNDNSNRVLNRNPSVVATRDFVNKIYVGGFPIKIIIDEGCKNLIADNEFLKEDADGGKLKTKVKDPLTDGMIEKYGHTADSEIYFLCSAFSSMFEEK